MTYPTVPLQIPIFMIGIQLLNSPLINKLLKPYKPSHKEIVCTLRNRLFYTLYVIGTTKS